MEYFCNLSLKFQLSTYRQVFVRKWFWIESIACGFDDKNSEPVWKWATHDSGKCTLSQLISFNFSPLLIRTEWDHNISECFNVNLRAFFLWRSQNWMKKSRILQISKTMLRRQLNKKTATIFGDGLITVLLIQRNSITFINIQNKEEIFLKINWSY